MSLRRWLKGGAAHGGYVSKTIETSPIQRKEIEEIVRLVQALNPFCYSQFKKLFVMKYISSARHVRQGEDMEEFLDELSFNIKRDLENYIYQADKLLPPDNQRGSN